MRYIELIKNPTYMKKIGEFISYKTLKGHPCPFCRDKEVLLEKVDDRQVSMQNNLWGTEIRVSCKTCRRVENYIQVVSDYIKKEIVKIILLKSYLHLTEEFYLKMEDGFFLVYDRCHKFKLELPAFSINYLKMAQLIEKIELMEVFS